MTNKLCQCNITFFDGGGNILSRVGEDSGTLLQNSIKPYLDHCKGEAYQDSG